MISLKFPELERAATRAGSRLADAPVNDHSPRRAAECVASGQPEATRRAREQAAGPRTARNAGRAAVRGPLVVLLLCTLVSLSPSASGQRPSPTLRFEAENTIVIENVTPFGTVAVFGISRSGLGVHATRFSSAKFLLHDKVGRGEIRHSFGRPIAARGIWAIVDTKTGAYSVTAQGGISVSAAAQVLGRSVKPRKSGDATMLDVALPWAEVMVVRPGQGVWIGTVADGGPVDGDGAVDGRMQVRADRLESIRTNRPARVDRIRRQDVVVIIDPMSLGLFSSDQVGE